MVKKSVNFDDPGGSAVGGGPGFIPPKSGMGRRDYEDDDAVAADNDGDIAVVGLASNVGNGDTNYSEPGETDHLTSPVVDTSTWDDNNLAAAKAKAKAGKAGKDSNKGRYSAGKGGDRDAKLGMAFGSPVGDYHRKNRACCCGLSKKAVIVLTALVLVVLALAGLVVALGIQVFWRRTLDLDKTCMEPECLRASAMLRGSVNTSVSPCGGVWQFSCGSWLQSNPIPPTKSKWGVFEKLRYQAVEAYRSLVNTLPQPLEADQLHWKLKHFYDSCMDLDNINIEQARQLKYDIRELGGWAVLRTWNPNTYDYHNVLKRLHANYRVEPFFSVRVVPDDKHPESNIIKIGPSGLGLPDRSYYFRGPDDPTVHSYQQYLEDTVKELGAQGPDAKQFAHNMFHLEKRIAEFTPVREDIANPVLTYNRITIRSLKTIASSVPWLDIIREVFPEAGITADTQVLIVSKRYVQDVSQLFFNNDKEALNNFLMWKLADGMVPHLSAQFRAVYDLYHVDITGAREPPKRWEMCAQALEQNFGFAIGAMFWQSLEDRDKITKRVEEMFGFLKEKFIDDVAHNKVLPEEMKSRGVEKVRRMELQVGYPDKMLQVSFLQNLYKKMTVQKNDFYRNTLNGIRYRRMVEQAALRDGNGGGDSSEAGDFKWRHALLADEPTYVFQSNLLVIPSYMLQAPFFNPGFPRSFNYGSVGALMAKAMTRAVDEVGVHYSADGVLDPYYFHADSSVSNNTVIDDFEPGPEWSATGGHLAKPRECLHKAYLELELGDSNEVSRAVNCSSMDVAGLRLALYALEDSLKEEEEPPQPGLPYFPEGIFFLSYAQMFCGDVRKEQQELDSIVSRCFPSKTRLRAVLTQMKEFGYSFECNGDDWSRSSRKCGRIL